MEKGKPTPIPPDANKHTAQRGGGIADPYFTTDRVHRQLQCLHIRVQHAVDDTTVLIESPSFALYHVRLFGQHGEGVKTILPSMKGNKRDTTIEALGSEFDLNTLTISFPREKADSIKRVLCNLWPKIWRYGQGREYLSMAGKFWNFTCVVGVGRYFV